MTTLRNLEISLKRLLNQALWVVLLNAQVVVSLTLIVVHSNMYLIHLHISITVYFTRNVVEKAVYAQIINLKITFFVKKVRLMTSEIFPQVMIKHKLLPLKPYFIFCIHNRPCMYRRGRMYRFQIFGICNWF